MTDASRGVILGAVPASLANPELEEARPHSLGEEELQLQLALAMSKEEAETDAKKKTNDDLKLQLALEESKREEPSAGAPSDEVSAVYIRHRGAGVSAVYGVDVKYLTYI